MLKGCAENGFDVGVWMCPQNGIAHDQFVARKETASQHPKTEAVGRRPIWILTTEKTPTSTIIEFSKKKAYIYILILYISLVNFPSCADTTVYHRRVKMFNRCSMAWKRRMENLAEWDGLANLKVVIKGKRLIQKIFSQIGLGSRIHLRRTQHLLSRSQKWAAGLNLPEAKKDKTRSRAGSEINDRCSCNTCYQKPDKIRNQQWTLLTNINKSFNCFRVLGHNHLPTFVRQAV